MTWPMKPLSELCELAIDCVNKTAPVVEGPTPYKMIRTTNVKGGFIDTKTVRYVTKDTFEKWTRRSRPQYGDVILTREAPVGEVGRCTFSDAQNIFLGQRLFQYRPKAELLDWNYLAYALQSPVVQNKLHGVSFGATVPHVKVGDAESLEIPCPGFDVQKHIGETLAAYDDLIENNQRRIALLEESARLLYREWFVNLRFPGHESVKIKNGLPHGWCKSTIAEQTSFLNRGIAPAYNDTALGLVINQKCIRDGSLSMLPARKQSKEVKPERLIQVGDVLINSTGAGTLGRVAQVRKSIDHCTVDTHVTIARPFSQDWAAYFGQALLNLEPVFSSMGKGATNQLELNRADIGAIEIWRPQVALVKNFHAIVWPMIEQAETLLMSNRKLGEARDLLLPKLMSGKIKV